MVPPLSASVFHQIVGGEKQLHKRLSELLKVAGLKRFRAAVAYARWDGIGLVSKQIETLLAAGVTFESIYGFGNGVTTPDAFLYSLYLQKLYTKHAYAGMVEDKFANAIFHPKFFEFQFADRTVAIIGSANFTGGGMIRNTELGVEIEFKNSDALASELQTAWDNLKAESVAVTAERIRALKKMENVGSEIDTSEGTKKPSKPFLPTTATVSPKPLFEKILGLKFPKKKFELLAESDPLTEKPGRLYLQVLKNETGGLGGKAGYQIQLPRATLAAYFGVGPKDAPEAIFKFGAETIIVHFTHFDNNTHRLRLMPLRDIERPAIVIFHRAGPSSYNCKVVPKAAYAKVLASKCTQQTRTGARRWGLE